MSDVVLTAALRSNLLSLQNTQFLIDSTQFRLATGRKVNSALDNPQNFFAAQSLNNRASDLTRLLDGIGQSIQTLKAADNGVSGLTKLVEQAEAVANSAREAVVKGGTEARVTGNRDLRGITDLTTLAGVSDTSDRSELRIQILDTSSTTPGALVDFDTTGATDNIATIQISSGDSIEQLITKINDLQADTTTGDVAVLEAELTSEGYLEIKTLNGGDLRINFIGDDTNANTDATNIALAADLGFGSLAQLAEDNTGTNDTEVTASASRLLKSFALYEGTNDLAERSDTLEDLENSAGTVLFDNLNNAADLVNISVNGGTAQQIGLNAQTIQGFIDGINSNDTLKNLIKADYSDATGEITIEAIDASVQYVTFGAESNAGDEEVNFGFGVKDFTNVLNGAANGQDEVIRFGSAAAQLADLESDYNRIREQIDQLVEDSGYRGTNLLSGDNLVTFFNEDRSNYLTTEGATFTASGLGVSAGNFASTVTVDSAITELKSALDTLRNFGSSIANDLSIIQTREDFTKNTINTLTEGSDKLTIADQNEEGAKLLSLQTRQQLGVTSLALASQSQQSILRLF